jgi:hypothetical protein
MTDRLPNDARAELARVGIDSFPDASHRAALNFQRTAYVHNAPALDAGGTGVVVVAGENPTAVARQLAQMMSSGAWVAADTADTWAHANLAGYIHEHAPERVYVLAESEADSLRTALAVSGEVMAAQPETSVEVLVTLNGADPSVQLDTIARLTPQLDLATFLRAFEPTDASTVPPAAEAPLPPHLAVMAERQFLARAYLANDAPPRDWLLDGLLPARTEAGMVAPGGTGKGLVSLSLAVHVAVGRNWGPFPVPRARGVLLLAFEDDATELHRRLASLVRELNLTVAERARLGENLEIKPLRGVAGAALSAKFAPAIVHAARSVPDCGLVVLDPLTRAVELPDGLSINSQEGAGYLMRLLGRVVTEANASFLYVHHVSKHAMREGMAMSATAATGSQQLVDLARLMVNLGALNRDQAHALGLATERADGSSIRYVRLEVSKANAPVTDPTRWAFEIAPTGAALWREGTARTSAMLASEGLDALVALAEETGAEPDQPESWPTREEMRSRMTRDGADKARAVLVRLGALVVHRRAREVLETDAETGTEKRRRLDTYQPTDDARARVDEALAGERAADETCEEHGRAAL